MSPPRPERAALFLDFDGTLVDIVDRPGDVVLAPEAKAMLGRLIERCDGAVAVVSGRKIEDIDRFVDLPVAAAGMHGLQHRREPGGPIEAHPAPEALGTLRDRLKAHGLLSGGVTLEDKGAGLAVHYRAEPQREDEVYAAMDELTADLSELGLIHGKMVVEAKSKSHDKGAAVRTFMDAPPFAGRVPIFIGDDVTDEDGIRAAQDAGGLGIKVGDGDTAARHRLADVAHVHAYLGSFVE